MVEEANDSAPAEAPAASTTPKKGKAGAKPKAVKSTGEKKVAAHPASAVMILEAVSTLAEKGGSSIQAIKKYIVDTYKVDIERQNNVINKALRKLVETGKLNQPKGTGASGSFKLPPKAKAEKKPVTEKKPAKEKPAAEKKPRAKKGGSPVKKAKVAASPAKKGAAKPKKVVKKKAPVASPEKAASPKKKAPAAKPKPAKAAAKPAAAAEKKAKKPAAPKVSKVKLPKTLNKPAAPTPKTTKKTAPKTKK